MNNKPVFVYLNIDLSLAEVFLHAVDCFYDFKR